MIPAAFRRRAVVEPDAPVNVLSDLVARRDALAGRLAAVREKAAALDAAEAASRTDLEAAATAGEDTERHAEALAQLAARRVAIGHERTAVEAAFVTAKAAVEAEETRIRELETDAKIAELRTAEEKAEATFKTALVACGVSYENVLAAEKVLDRALSDAKRATGKGFTDAGYRSVEAAQAEARNRISEARASGAAGQASHLGEGPRIPFAVISRW